MQDLLDQISKQETMITDSRRAKMQALVANRQYDLTIILENIHDPHNLGAVLRTADCVGLNEIYAIYSKETPDNLAELIGYKTTSGSLKWVDVHFFTDAESCMAAVRKKYDKIFATHLGVESKSLYDLELSSSVALLFGNEHRGVSEEALALVDGNFIIPQVGMVQSLNISVACAVCLYEASRQRILAGNYDRPFDLKNDHQRAAYAKFLQDMRPM